MTQLPTLDATPRGSQDLHPLARLPQEWRELAESWQERAFRGDQVFQWLHGKGVSDPNRMSNLPKTLKARLGEFDLEWPGSVEQVLRSKDGTRKLLISLPAGGQVECVVIPMTKQALHDDAESDDADPGVPVTLCISTQYGCAMACAFCASGQAGLKRGLGAAEVVMQVVFAKRYLEPNETLRNLVFMGMGEPLHHYDQTARALRLISHPEGLGIGPRRITVSTVGLIPGIERLGADFEGKVGLAISLHAPNDAIRDQIIPMNKKYPMAKLLAALRAYPLPPRRRITIEYILIKNVNDRPEHARSLAGVLRGLPVKVNLIPMNPIEASALAAPSERDVERFRQVLVREGYSCFVRTTRGDDVAAACGQLAFQDQAGQRG